MVSDNNGMQCTYDNLEIICGTKLRTKDKHCAFMRSISSLLRENIWSKIEVDSLKKIWSEPLMFVPLGTLAGIACGHIAGFPNTGMSYGFYLASYFESVSTIKRVCYVNYLDFMKKKSDQQEKLAIKYIQSATPFSKRKEFTHFAYYSVTGSILAASIAHVQSNIPLVPALKVGVACGIVKYICNYNERQKKASFIRKEVLNTQSVFVSRYREIIAKKEEIIAAKNSLIETHEKISEKNYLYCKALENEKGLLFADKDMSLCRNCIGRN